MITFFSSFFYLYKLSYLYSVVIGFFITYVIGYIMSRLLKALDLSGIDRVYIDGNKNLVAFDLFFPPVAKSLRNVYHVKHDGLLSTTDDLLSVTKL